MRQYKGKKGSNIDIVTISSSLLSLMPMQMGVYSKAEGGEGRRWEKVGEGGRRREKEGEGGRRREKEGEGGRRREKEGEGGRRREKGERWEEEG
jgi:hypothetical protein